MGRDTGKGGRGRNTRRAAKPKAEQKQNQPKAKVVREGGIVPLFATAKIDGKPSRRVFTPDNADQREELLRLGAARECTAAELTLMNLDGDRSGEPGGSLPNPPAEDGDAAEGGEADAAEGGEADAAEGGEADAAEGGEADAAEGGEASGDGDEIV